MSSEKWIVYLKESDGWVKAALSYTSYKAALKAVEECQYAPDEYRIVKVERNI